MAGQIITKTLNQEVISEVNQPLYIGGKLADGSDAKVTIASNGNVSTATPLTVPSLTVNSKPVMSSLLAEYTVTGSAVTSIDFSGLDINTHKSYRVEIDWNNPTASNVALYLYVNGDTTTTNYYCQGFGAIGSTTSVIRSNAAYFGYTMSNSSTFTVGNILKSNGYINIYSVANESNGSSVIISTRMLTKTATVTNITQLTFAASVANSIGVGSTIRLYRGDV